MSELRQNMLTKQWYVIASERKLRPDEFEQPKSPRPTKEYEPDCPFCPGNEEQTTPELDRVSNSESWRVRVFKNKFSVFHPTGDRKRRFEGIYRSMSGVGVHEVIVESPRHDQTITDLPIDHLTDLVAAYRRRANVALSNENVELVIPFKNYGPAAGTSIFHSHSQLIGVPIVPSHIGYRVEEVLRHWRETGNCPLCRMMRQELMDSRRLVHCNESFVSFVPYACGFPCEMWIVPRQHQACFEDLRDKELPDFAEILLDGVKRLYVGLDDPDYNFTVRSNPKGFRHSAAFHWYVKLMPRKTRPAGFELGTGMFINETLPEEDAEFLRSLAV